MMCHPPAVAVTREAPGSGSQRRERRALVMDRVCPERRDGGRGVRAGDQRPATDGHGGQGPGGRGRGQRHQVGHYWVTFRLPLLSDIQVALIE